jgi:hypothetical protein
MNLVESKPVLGLKPPLYDGLKPETQLSSNLFLLPKPPKPPNPPKLFFILDGCIPLHIKFLYFHVL